MDAPSGEKAKVKAKGERLRSVLSAAQVLGMMVISCLLAMMVLEMRASRADAAATADTPTAPGATAASITAETAANSAMARRTTTTVPDGDVWTLLGDLRKVRSCACVCVCVRVCAK